MTPLKIEFHLGSPVVVDSEYPTHLDGLLAWARVKEAEERGDANPWLAGEDLPLERAGSGDDWVWQASRLIFEAATPRQIVNMQRKCDPDRFYHDFDQGLWKGARGNKPPTINTVSGQQRAYQYYTSVQWMARVEAWCVGDADRVRTLLGRIEHLGKMGRNGFGQVLKITVTEDESAQERWRLRVLPDDVPGLDGVEYGVTQHPPRAPYWDKIRRVSLREPVI